MEPQIERCTVDQAPVLTEIAHAAKRHWGYPERYIEAWSESLTVGPEMVRHHQVWACRVGEEVAGFYVLMRSGYRMELEHLWVRPDFIGKGIGRYLMHHAVRLAREAGVHMIDITSDPNAEGFYRRIGARRVGEVYAPVDGTSRHLPRLALEVGT